MILLDEALRRREAEGRPIRVGLVGAGFMGRPIALHLSRAVPGMDVVAIANRHREKAETAYRDAGVEGYRSVASREALEAAIDEGVPAVTEDARLLCAADGIDLLFEVTGSIDFGARVVLEAIGHGKHVVLMNAELDGTVGPLLKSRADAAGVVYTNSDGDQPGVIMNLYRFVRGIGCRPRLCGNIKGLQDPYRTPTTQEAFARRWGQKPHMVTSFADGTKVSFEMAVVANATGFGVAKRGMYGPEVPADFPIEHIAAHYPEAVAHSEGLVDYCVGASPGPGVFVLATNDHPVHRHYMNLYKLGEGPLYCFYTPYHLCHFEVHNSIARAVEFADGVVVPAGGPRVEVVAIAKRDLERGDRLDGIGRYMTYGECENHEAAREADLLPMGLAEGCRLKRDVSRDRALTFGDVVLPPSRLRDELWWEQLRQFDGSPDGDTPASA